MVDPGGKGSGDVICGDRPTAGPQDTKYDSKGEIQKPSLKPRRDPCNCRHLIGPRSKIFVTVGT